MNPLFASLLRLTLYAVGSGEFPYINADFIAEFVARAIEEFESLAEVLQAKQK